MAASDYQRLAGETSAEAFVRRALDLLAADLRQLALLALGEWQQVGIATPELLPALAALQNPTAGAWNGLLRVLLEARHKALSAAGAAERKKLAAATGLEALADFWNRTPPPPSLHALQPLARIAGAEEDAVSFANCVQGAIQLATRAAMSPEQFTWEQARRDLLGFVNYLAADPLAAIGALMSQKAGVASDAPAALAAPEFSLADPGLAPAFSALIGRPELSETSFRQLLARHAPESFPGFLLGDFLVGRPVGEGGFGTVHLARQISTGRKVAVKLLHDGMPPEIQARFQREAAFLARFNHPHIVGVLAYGKARWAAPPDAQLADEPWFAFFARSAPEKSFIALEWIEGQTLDAIYRQSQSDPAQRRDVRTLAEWFAQSARALAAVHAANLVHRDVKPSNLMVTEDGAIKLMDFGIARVQEDQRTLVTATGRIFGTVVYMSPEQIRAAETEALVGPGTDIYSLCATFYELFTLTRLYEHDRQSIDSVRTRKLTGQRPSPPRAQVRDLPWEIEVMLLGGLEAEVADRYRSMEDLERDLRHFLRDEPIAYRRPSMARRARLAYRRHQAVSNVVAAGLLVTVIAALIGTTLYRRAAAREQAALALALEERGRQELLNGQPLLAATHLNQAYSMGRSSPALRFMLAAALRSLPASSGPAQGHTKGVYTAEYNKDNTKIVTAGRDGTVRIWDAKTGLSLALELSAAHEVSGAMFSPDGTRVVAADDGGNAAVWDAATGKKLLTLPPQHQKLYTPNFSPTGTRIITACEDGCARIFDAATGVLLKELPHKAPLVCAFFNRTETRILTGCADGSSPLWDAQTYALIRAITTTGPVTRAVFSPRGDKIAVSSLERFGSVKLYDAATGNPVPPALAALNNVDVVRRVVFSPDGTKLVASNRDGLSCWWDLQAGEIAKAVPIEHDQGVFSTAFSHAWLFGTAGRNGVVKLWDATNASFVRELVGHVGPVYQLVFSADDSQILTAGEDATARIWDTQTGKLLHILDGRPFPAVTTNRAPDDFFYKINLGPTLDSSILRLLAIQEDSNVTRAAFTPDSQSVLLCSQVPALRSAVTGLPVNDQGSIALESNASCLSPDGKYIAAVNVPGIVATLSFSGAEFHMVQLDPIAARGTSPASAPAADVPRPTLYDIAYSRDGKFLVVGGTGGVWILEAATLRVLRALPGAQGNADILRVEFSPDGGALVTIGSDHSARLWDLTATPATFKVLPHKADVNWAAFSPDGRYVLTASNDADAALWDARTGVRLRTFNQGNTDYVMMAAFSPDGTRVATADRDYTARVYDTATGRLVATMQGRSNTMTSAGTLLSTVQGHSNKVTSANFSPDGALLATTSEDGTAMLWEAATGKLLSILNGHKGDVRWAQFSPDGTRLVTAGDDRRAILWDTRLETRTPDQVAALLH